MSTESLDDLCCLTGGRGGGGLEEVAKAVGGGYSRLQMPLRLALAVTGTVAGHRLGPLEEGGVPMHPRGGGLLAFVRDSPPSRSEPKAPKGGGGRLVAEEGFSRGLASRWGGGGGEG